jgi:hypothetical protein
MEASEASPQIEPVSDMVRISRMTGRDWLLLALILVVAAGLRYARARVDGLTFDEQWHLELSTGRGSPHVRVPENVLVPDAPAVTSLVGAPPFHAVWAHMDRVVHPPLFVLGLRLWRDALGGGDLPAKLYSVACSLVGIALLYDAARNLHGRTAAFWACLLWAVAPTQVFIDQQVRGYTLLAALGMGACAAVVRIEKVGATRRRLVALGACALGMMLTHYFAIGACAAIAVYVLIRLRGRARRDAVIALVAAGFVYGIIWGPFFWKQRRDFSETADPWLVEQVSNHALVTSERFASLPWKHLLDDYGTLGSLPIVAVVVFIVPVALALSRKRPEMLLWVLWFAGTAGFVAALDLARSTKHLLFLRYTSLAAPAIFVVIAAVAANFGGLVKHIVPATLVALAALSWRGAYVAEEPDWRQLGQVLDEHAAPGEAIVYYRGRYPQWYVEIFYLGTSHYSHEFPRPIVKLAGPASVELSRELPGQSAWIVSGQLDRPIEEILPGFAPVEQYELPNLAIVTRVKRTRP